MSEGFHFQTRIRFIDTDASGRIHYTAMFRYFESAEIELMRSLDISYRSEDFGFPRVHAECDFKLAMNHDDLVDIEARITRVGASSIRFEFQTRKSGALAAAGVIIVACMDKTTQCSRPIPEAVRERLTSAVTPSFGPREKST